MVKVEFKGVEYEYRFDLGAQMRYEQLAGKLSEEQKTPTVASSCMHYACLAADEKFTMSLAEFVNGIDSQQVLEVLNAAFAAERNRWEGLNVAADEPGDKSAKSKKK